MKIAKDEDRVYVVGENMDVWSIIREITASGLQEDAFYIFNVGDLLKKYEIWTEAMPRVKPYYAVKCNDSMNVLEVLAALGTGFDCASKAEIKKVMSIGVRPDRIIFANPAKPRSHIKFSNEWGVKRMTFDNESELHKIKQICPDAQLVIRFRCDGLAQAPLGMKFGCDPIVEAPQLLRTARDLGLDVVGCSFHVGSGCREPEVFERALSMARELFDVAAVLGYQWTLLDIGGGFPGDKNTSIDEIASIVNTSLARFFPDEHAVDVIAEPGRFFVAAAYTLACAIHSVRRLVNRAPPSATAVSAEDAAASPPPPMHIMYYINDGIYGSFNCLLYDHQRVHPRPLAEYPGGKWVSSSIWGPTCDGLDQVAHDVALPEMGIGDWIVFENMGAYTLPVASPFNGFPVPRVRVIADEIAWKRLKELPFSEDHFILNDAKFTYFPDSQHCKELPKWMSPLSFDALEEIETIN